jgi:hypothetical protein
VPSLLAEKSDAAFAYHNQCIFVPSLLAEKSDVAFAYHNQCIFVPSLLAEMSGGVGASCCLSDPVHLHFRNYCPLRRRRAVLIHLRLLRLLLARRRRLDRFLNSLRDLLRRGLFLSMLLPCLPVLLLLLLHILLLPALIPLPPPPPPPFCPPLFHIRWYAFGPRDDAWPASLLLLTGRCHWGRSGARLAVGLNFHTKCTPSPPPTDSAEHPHT